MFSVLLLLCAVTVSHGFYYREGDVYPSPSYICPSGTHPTTVYGQFRCVPHYPQDLPDIFYRGKSDLIEYHSFHPGSTPRSGIYPPRGYSRLSTYFGNGGAIAVPPSYNCPYGRNLISYDGQYQCIDPYYAGLDTPLLSGSRDYEKDIDSHSSKNDYRSHEHSSCGGNCGPSGGGGSLPGGGVYIPGGGGSIPSGGGYIPGGGGYIPGEGGSIPSGGGYIPGGGGSIPGGGVYIPGGGGSIPSGGGYIPGGGVYIPGGGGSIPSGGGYIPGGGYVPGGAVYIPGGGGCPAGGSCYPGGTVVYVPACQSCTET